MTPKEIKYNLHYDDVRGDFLRPPHGTTVYLRSWAPNEYSDQPMDSRSLIRSYTSLFG